MPMHHRPFCLSRDRSDFSHFGIHGGRMTGGGVVLGAKRVGSARRWSRVGADFGARSVEVEPKSHLGELFGDAP
jgi:hypothetical protein